MDFFKSVFSDEPQSEEVEEESGEENPNPDSPSADAGESLAAAGLGGWNFGSLMKTITARSEEVIETYRRDLDEFRIGLTQEARAVAANLPASLETGASVAQESLESVGQAIDVVFKSTADIISQALDNPAPAAAPAGSSSSVKKFTRFEMQLHAVQNDYNTYCEDPDDVEEFNKWRSGLSMEEKADEIAELCEDNAAVGVFFTKLVPKNVDAESFWARYFFRVHKLKLVEEARDHLVKRVLSGEEDEDLSWDVDDDDVAESSESQKNEVVGSEKTEKTSNGKIGTKASESPGRSNLESESLVEIEGSKGPSDPSTYEHFELDSEIAADGKSKGSGEVKEIPYAKTLAKAKTDSAESSKNSDFSVVSSQTSVQEEEDLGWDEIEDLGSNDDKKTTSSGGSPNMVDIRRRLNAVEGDEDLNWDVEDDEDVKS